MKTPILTVAASDGGQRLDQFLTAKLGNSRSYWQTAIKQSWVQVNDKPAKASYPIVVSDKIGIALPAAPETTNLELNFPILYQDEHIMAIDKPSGILVHDIPGRRSESTVAQFAAHNSSDRSQGRPGIVHRLDRDTSGVLLIARDEATKTYLQDQFRQRKVVKTYQLLVHGHLTKPEATIDLPIGRLAHTSKRAVVPTGKPAQTNYRVIREFDHSTLIEAQPKTGRTHQLRVHFAYLGHPIVGDKLYGQSHDKAIPRLFLHAARLQLDGPDGKKLDISSPLPTELSAIL